MSAAAGPSRPINVLQVCDHLGWEGSRMHGVKRLFAWMIPRFDKSRFNVSLVSLRKKRPLRGDAGRASASTSPTCTRSKFDPATLPALLKVIDRKQIDILHLHGYGATTFGRLAGAMRGIPTILHEHANLTDTPWFQKVADRGARAVYGSSRSPSRRARPTFVVTARHDSGRTRESRISGRAARRVRPCRTPRRDRGRARRARHRAR